MRNSKKHIFRYKDPELTKEPDKKNITEPTMYNDLPAFIKKDLRRVLFATSLFGLLIVAIYLVQTRTDILAPVLNFFGL